LRDKIRYTEKMKIRFLEILVHFLAASAS